jgi:hypothetical protein
MTVSEFIKKLKEFGYDENTELVFWNVYQY